MKITGKTKLILGAAFASTAALTVAIVILVSNQTQREPSSNPWDYTMYAFGEHNSLKSVADNLSVQGDIRTNGSMNLNGKNASVSGFVISGNTVSDGLKSFEFEKKIENEEILPHDNVFQNIYDIAEDGDCVTYQKEDISENFVRFNNPVIVESEWNVNVSADISPVISEEPRESEKKFGAFGAGFLTSVYENPTKWNNVLPIFYQGSGLNNDESGLKSLLELGEKSNFIPIGEQSVSENWKFYEKLPAGVFQENFNQNYVPNYINSLKEENKQVFSVGQSEKTVIIEAGHDKSMINPTEALDAKSLTVTGGSLTLNGNYESLEEIRLDNWGGIQLIGNFPNLKHIYKTSWGNLNLAGDFSALKCVYMSGGQILLGNGNNGFQSDNAAIINENGHIIVYTAKDVTLTNSRIVTNHNITIRGAGKNTSHSGFNAENSLFASNNGLGFEDMSDNNEKRYQKLPVFYSNIPMSFVNCNFELMQGAYISKNGAMTLTESDIKTFRGFLFSPLGIDENASNSSVGLYLDTWSYNVDPDINSLNIQQNGIWNIGSIGAIEAAEFPNELAKNIGNTENFISKIQTIQNAEGKNEDKYVLGESGNKPGAFILNSYLIADSDIHIDVDYLSNSKNDKSVIASRNGNIIININSEIDFNGIIYAPNGRVTITGSGKINGRIFAQDIEIISDSLVITNDGEDISHLGFTAPKDPKPTETTLLSTTTVSGSSSTGTGTDIPKDTTTTTTVTTITPGTSGGTTTSIPATTTVSSTVSGTNTSPTEITTISPSEPHIPVHNQAKYEYDKLDRLIKVIYDEDNYIEYTYDSNGNIKKVKTVKDGKTQ
ncbi:MAG: hypothetical protein GX896_04985 [Clostridiales bacterium]|nr:hypothetical protein [Clostridiales bacterium]